MLANVDLLEKELESLNTREVRQRIEISNILISVQRNNSMMNYQFYWQMKNHWKDKCQRLRI